MYIIVHIYIYYNKYSNTSIRRHILLNVLNISKTRIIYIKRIKSMNYILILLYMFVYVYI